MARFDPRPTPRRRDPDLLRILHASPNKLCALCEGSERLELHHVLGRGAQRGDDVRANLVWLCHDEHFALTIHQKDARRALGQHLLESRPDTIDYVIDKLGSGPGRDWLARRLFINV